MTLTFSDTEIHKLFGHEAAESEDLSRLREYYFKTDTYQQVNADLPLRLLVAHKGVGKSALFQVAMAEREEANEVAVLIRPDDVIGIGTDTSDFLRAIRDWKDGLLHIIGSKILSSFGSNDSSPLSKAKNLGGRFVDVIAELSRPFLSGASLVPAKRALIDSFLNKRRVTVFVDDLDRGWQGRKEDVTRISALLNAVRDLSSDSPGLNFKISLRSDVYYLVRTSDESTDKIEGSVVWQSWTNHEIFVLLVKRIETFFGRSVDEQELVGTKQALLANYLDPVIEHRFEGEGHWKNAPMYRVLMSLIRKRPRDLVKLLTLAAKETRSRNDNLIRTRDLKAIFEEYSQGRIQDTINEFRSELPDIERLLMNMKPSRKEKTAREGFCYKTDELLRKIDNITSGGAFRAVNGKTLDRKGLAAFLYKINFLVARKDLESGLITRKYFEENRYLSSNLADFGFDWEVHPAYRWALQPEDLGEVFRSLKLSAE